MPHQHHSTLREGLLTGLIGGMIVFLWYLVSDVLRGTPLQTPSTLGQVFAGREDTIAAVPRVVPLAVAEYTLLHFAVFALLGIVMAKLTHLAIRNPAMRMGVWLGLVIAFVFFLGYLLLIYWMTDQRLNWWSALLVDVIGIGSMGLYLWRSHPELRASVRRVPLGAEVKSPPHPPGAPRA